MGDINERYNVQEKAEISSCTPLALANNRQLNNSTVVIPTDHNMDSLLSVELIRDFQTTAVFRTDQEQFDRYQLTMTAVRLYLVRSQSVHINRRERCPCNCTSKFMCSYPEFCDAKIHFVQELQGDGIDRRVLCCEWFKPQGMRTDDIMFGDKARCHAERRAFLVLQLMSITKLSQE